MCGIAGFWVKDGGVPQDFLRGLAGVLAHRGPDGSGACTVGAMGLTQTRLAIIDLQTGDQPLYGPDGTALIANGEIYNYRELRGEFPNAVFATQSDCEVPLFVFARDGSYFTDVLRGMYAIALADPADATLYLARDPFGIKPLYYAQTEDMFLFASEPEALLRSGAVPRTLRRSAATELLQLQFTTGRETIYAGINRVLPGETLEIRNGDIASRSRQHALPDGAPRALTETAALAQLDTILMESVALHQRSDVPYGMFLSGGVDSSALLACMARLNEHPVRAFTAGFPGTNAHDEREHARAVAKAVGAEHIEISVTEADFWASMPAIAAAMDDPAADYACLPTYMLAHEAAKELKVVLSGEGGDELFAGYGRYRAATKPRLLGGRAMRRRGALDGFGILREAQDWRASFDAAARDTDGHGWDALQRAQALDCADWLPNDLLTKLDRCLMAHGLEGRTPFLDPAVADFAFRLPKVLKLAGGQGKYLLRKWLEGALPVAKPFSKKRGFTVPVGEWMRPKALALGPLIAGVVGVAEICHVAAVRQIFEQFSRGGEKRAAQACWNLLFYALWYRIHIEAKPVAGDIFAQLEAR